MIVILQTQNVKSIVVSAPAHFRNSLTDQRLRVRIVSLQAFFLLSSSPQFSYWDVTLCLPTLVLSVTVGLLVVHSFVFALCLTNCHAYGIQERQEGR